MTHAVTHTGNHRRLECFRRRTVLAPCVATSRNLYQYNPFIRNTFFQIVIESYSIFYESWAEELNDRGLISERTSMAPVTVFFLGITVSLTYIADASDYSQVGLVHDSASKFLDSLIQRNLYFQVSGWVAYCYQLFPSVQCETPPNRILFV